MPEQWWVCKTCKKSSQLKQEIVNCEIDHVFKQRCFSIVHMLWTSTKPQEFPEYITVKFGDSSKQEVIYKLSQIVNRATTETKCTYCMKSTFEHAHYCPHNPYADRYGL